MLRYSRQQLCRFGLRLPKLQVFHKRRSGSCFRNTNSLTTLTTKHVSVSITLLSLSNSTNSNSQSLRRSVSNSWHTTKIFVRKKFNTRRTPPRWKKRLCRFKASKTNLLMSISHKLMILWNRLNRKQQLSAFNSKSLLLILTTSVGQRMQHDSNRYSEQSKSWQSSIPRRTKSSMEHLGRTTQSMRSMAFTMCFAMVRSTLNRHRF